MNIKLTEHQMAAWEYRRPGNGAFAGRIVKVAKGYQVTFRDKWGKNNILPAIEDSKADALDVLKTALYHDGRH